MKCRLCLCSTLSRQVVKLPDEPRPVPAGMSATLVSSMLGASTPVSLSASRMIGCLMSATFLTRSICEYRNSISLIGVSWKFTYTYCVIAADSTNPPCAL